MKVCLISTSDLGHGAGMAAFRLHVGLKSAGVDCSLLVSEKLSNDLSVYQLTPEPSSLLGRVVLRLKSRFEYLLNRAGPQNYYSFNSIGLSDHPLVRGADLIHFHNIHWHYCNFTPRLLSQLSKSKPVVWTFHDMWPLTGHCISSRDCERWRNGCGSCPYPDAYIPLLFDSSKYQFQLKKRLYEKSKFTVVTPSRWMTSLVLESPLLKRHPVRNIPNGIDNNIFSPQDGGAIREEFALADSKGPFLLFVSAFLDDPIKGYSYFEKAVMLLIDAGRLPASTVVLLVGRGSGTIPLKERVTVVELGYVTSQERMAQIFSAADAYIMPSILDNFPSVVLESLACGTPVVSFNTGGIPEMIIHGETGYVARLKDVQDLARGIEWVSGEVGQTLSERCVLSVSRSFTVELQVERHLELYRELTA